MPTVLAVGAGRFFLPLHQSLVYGRRYRENIVVGWLVVLCLTALSDSFSVYIGPSPKERERGMKG